MDVTQISTTEKVVVPRPTGNRTVDISKTEFYQVPIGYAWVEHVIVHNEQLKTCQLHLGTYQFRAGGDQMTAARIRGSK